MSNELRACPKCGGTSGFYKNLKVTGTAQNYARWGAPAYQEERAAGEDGLTYYEPKTVTCEDCGKRSPNPLAGTYRPAKRRR